MDAVVRWTLAQPGNEQVRSVNALVGETNDGGLNDIRALPVTIAHVTRAIAGAATGPVAEGAVGAGTGTIAFGWKGGIGTSSRRVRGAADVEWTVGVLVQTNYGGRLTMSGVPVWRELNAAQQGPGGQSASAPSAVMGASARHDPQPSSDGSCMIVIATDAPLDARDLERLAARAIFALARTGSTYSNGSGDFAIAFSTAVENRVTPGTAVAPRTFVPTDGVSTLFEATLDATEEAVYNSLLMATDMTGNGRTIRALPIEELRTILRKFGR